MRQSMPPSTVIEMCIRDRSEPLMDMMADKLGMDPFEFRYKNIARPGETNINSYPFRQYPMEKMMDTMRPLYEKAVAEAKAADTPEKRRGVGIAWGGFNVTEGTTDSAEVALELGADGRIWKYDTWHNTVSYTHLDVYKRQIW